MCVSMQWRRSILFAFLMLMANTALAIDVSISSPSPDDEYSMATNIVVNGTYSPVEMVGQSAPSLTVKIKQQGGPILQEVAASSGGGNWNATLSNPPGGWTEGNCVIEVWVAGGTSSADHVVIVIKSPGGGA